MVVVLSAVLTAASAVGIAYWLLAKQFVAGDANALDGIVQAPVSEPLVLRNVSLWDGLGGPVQPTRSVVIQEGRIAGIFDTASSSPAGVRMFERYNIVSPGDLQWAAGRLDYNDSYTNGYTNPAVGESATQNTRNH